MKKIQMLLLTTMVLMSCKTQQSVVLKAEIGNGFEPGSCYFSIRKEEDGEKEPPFVLEIIPPKYEKVEVDYLTPELERHITSKGYFQFQTRKPHLKFIMREAADLLEFTNVENPSGYTHCMVEVAPYYRTLTKEELSMKDNKVTITKIVQHSKIIKRYVRKKPKTLKENQYYFESGYWTALKRAISREGCGGIDIRKVKKELIKLGYNLTEDNLLNQDTKDALLDFQKKNGLKEGQFDMDTLKKLGIL